MGNSLGLQSHQERGGDIEHLELTQDKAKTGTDTSWECGFHLESSRGSWLCGRPPV